MVQIGLTTYRTTLIPCSSINFDYMYAPVCGCFSTFPVATITSGGPVTFCQGGSVTLNANIGSGLTYQWLKNGYIINGATNNTYVATQSGVYSVRVTGTNGCTSTSNTITVTAFTTATITTNYQPTDICQGDSVILYAMYAHNAVGLSYQWQIGGNNISGATISTYPATQSGGYSVIVDVNNSCPDTSTAILVTVNICQGSCVFVIPSTAEVVNSANPIGVNSDYYWVCSGNTLEGDIGHGKTVFLENNAVFNDSGSCHGVVYMRSGSSFLGSGGVSHTVYYEPGADTSNVGGFGTTLIPCSSITFDYTYAPAGDCPRGSLIRGNVFNDLNSDCVFDSLENGLTGWQVTVNAGQFYSYTDNSGNYRLYLDSGNYTVSLIDNESFWSQVCPVSPATYSLSLGTGLDTISNINFGLQADIYCPSMSIDISTWAVRPCSTSTYAVNYCNNGTIAAANATIMIILDNNMTYSGSTGNLISQTGNILTFDIGTVNPGQCHSFYLYVYISCNMSIVGQTLCVEANIYPDSICTPADPNWDHSSVSVEGECVNDSLACFTIYNTGDPGNGDMDGTSQYRIYENNILVYTGTFQVAGGDSLVICWPANGNTIRLEADQRPGHPGNSHPQYNIEMCGDNMGVFVLGQITVVPEDDEDNFVEIDCHVVTGSYDPNDKQVKPEGLSQTYHFIDSTDVLEYIIHFQNTGTDTAFNVVIRDTLSEYLDITTIEPGSSSQPYNLDIFGSNILCWTFNNILLPDSNVNESASNGFLKYKIHQMPGNPKGTVIENRAGIIFDFNEPVITNMVFNTVGYIDSVVTNMFVIYDKDVSVKVYPNPFNSTTTFEIEGINKTETFTFELYNIIGKQAQLITDITKNKFVISRKNLPDGIYIYKISSENKWICAGKLIVN